MKRILIIFVVFALFGVVRAQEKEASFLDKKNEVKLNIPLTVFGAFPELTYERIISEDFTIGASIGFSLRNKSSYGEMDFMATPYVRWFFGGNTKAMQKYAAGFFTEVSVSVLSGKKNILYSEAPGGNHMEKYGDDYTGVGLGCAIGWKRVTKNNWVGEIFLGVGKEIATDYNFYPRVGISIGKRF